MTSPLPARSNESPPGRAIEAWTYQRQACSWTAAWWFLCNPSWLILCTAADENDHEATDETIEWLIHMQAVSVISPSYSSETDSLDTPRY